MAKTISIHGKEYGPRKGLEGPFLYANGRVLYYDAVEGAHYDPTTDFYVEQSEIDLLHRMFANLIESI